MGDNNTCVNDTGEASTDTNERVTDDTDNVDSLMLLTIQLQLRYTIQLLNNTGSV